MAPPLPKLRQDRVRLIIFIYRKEDTSVEDFQNYWRNEHSQIFSSIAIVKKNLLGYEQVREAFRSRRTRANLEHCLSQSNSTAPVRLVFC